MGRHGTVPDGVTGTLVGRRGGQFSEGRDHGSTPDGYRRAVAPDFLVHSIVLVVHLSDSSSQLMLGLLRDGPCALGRRREP